MGLDISAYERIEKAIGNEAFDSAGEIIEGDGWSQLFVNPDYSERAKEIDDGKAYKLSGREHSFRAGSYSGYNNFRNSLAKMAGYKYVPADDYRCGYALGAWESESGAFWELINFSDCEGIIASSASEKLYKDFVDMEEQSNLEDERFRSTYQNFKMAFDIARGGGIVEFM